MEDVFAKETNERGKRTREIHNLSKGFPSPAHMVLFFPVCKIAALSSGFRYFHLPPKLVEGTCDRLCCKFKHAFSSFAFLQVVLRNSPQILGRRLKWDDGGYREWLPHFTVSPFFLLAIIILCVFASTSQLFSK